MRNCLTLCAAAMISGTLLSLVWTCYTPAPSAWAQGPRTNSRPTFAPPGIVPAEVDPLADFTPEERTNINVYEQVNRSVVNITTKAIKADVVLFLDAEFEGSGSGSILDRAGHVLTNHHVVAEAKEIKVTLYNGETFDAALVGHDAVNDIAVLKISAPPEMLFPVMAGDSGKLRVGQHIYAIGNPFGLERTLTVGIISSLNRSLPSRTGRTMKSIIQIDAALNRGNSGGPLLDSKARLVGMNTAIASSTGENTGVGFAIPVNTIMRVVPQLIAKGKVTRPDVGITKVYQADGKVLIAALTPGGPAERAGLQGFRILKKQGRRGPFVYEERAIDRSAADTVVAVDGNPVKNADDLLGFVEMKRPGDVVEITIQRENREVVVPVTLAAGE
jgi:S1-C subfamily serine protease